MRCLCSCLIPIGSSFAIWLIFKVHRPVFAKRCTAIRSLASHVHVFRPQFRQYGPSILPIISSAVFSLVRVSSRALSEGLMIRTSPVLLLVLRCCSMPRAAASRRAWPVRSASVTSNVRKRTGSADMVSRTSSRMGTSALQEPHQSACTLTTYRAGVPSPSTSTVAAKAGPVVSKKARAMRERVSRVCMGLLLGIGE